MTAVPDGFDIFMSVPYATDNDTTTTGSKTVNHLNLKNLRRKPRSTKRAELPIAPTFAAGRPIVPAEHVLCYLRAYCRPANRACIRRRAVYRAYHHTAAGARFANRNLLQRRPKHDWSTYYKDAYDHGESKMESLSWRRSAVGRLIRCP